MRAADIRDLGALDGPVLVFGGPYSNLQATRALRQQAGQLGIPPERCLCTGDVVAYCADPDATVAEIRDWGCVVMAGNCEQQLAAGALDCGCGFDDGSACDLLSAGWFAHADRHTPAQARTWMAGLPDGLRFTQNGRICAVIHGGVRDVSRFLWPVSDASELKEEVQALSALLGAAPDVVLAGHSGIPFARDVAGVQWINAGVIGMPPHDGSTQTRFVLLEDGKAEIRTLSYDWHSAQQAMLQAGLTQGYHRALGSGWWPSEDVLPLALRR